ncbi:uncharacterized protein PAC_15063 [Phialocephala subalpina]|uniref:Heterokaryon incompatibility domain-containing protein n=1 Tax=Phialocephala subalpina TaxID=576137 RepID=A0A1L7XJG3_9HELO|nr:uncharacterized protein PAC_15063 [Phialocephala subalpina]
MSSPKSLYRYQPLGVNEIRLLTYSVESPQPVWHFKHQNLDDEPEFYAVSYTWGQNASIPRAFVDVEDGIIEVGDNLNNLLHSLDSFDRSISIWIDAICINQSNDSEKMHQVPLMGRIYSDASKVLIYLGEPYSGNPDTGAQLPKIIKAMSKMETGGDQSHLQFGRPLATDLILNQMNIPWQYIDLYQELNLAEVESLMDPQQFRTTTPQFNESWDVMSLREYDGRIALPELQFLRSNLSRPLRPVRGDSTALPNTDYARSTLQVDLCVLTSTFHRRATVAADKILGLFGILQGDILNTVPLAPGVSQMEIYTSVGRFVLTNPTGFGNLALLHCIDTEIVDEDLPSWVPNFQSRLRASPLNPFKPSTQAIYNASSSPVRFGTTSLGTIRLRGRIVDRIDGNVDYDTYSWNYVFPPNIQYSCAAQLEFEKSCQQLCTSIAERHESSTGLESSYYSTLVAGARLQGTNLTRWSPSGSAYKKWMRRMIALADPDYDFLHMTRNPGAQFDIDSLRQIGNKALEVGGEAEEFHQRFYDVCKGRSFFSANRGELGIGPSRVKKGDLVVVFCGAKTPFVLRECGREGEEGRRYRLIGEAYVNGIMDREAFEQNSSGKDYGSWIDLA